MDGLSQLGLGQPWKACHNLGWGWYGRSVTTKAGAGMEGLSQLGMGLEWMVSHN